jgi:hypothetical protein
VLIADLGIPWSSHYPYQNDNVSGTAVRDRDPPIPIIFQKKTESDLTGNARSGLGLAKTEWILPSLLISLAFLQHLVMTPRIVIRISPAAATITRGVSWEPQEQPSCVPDPVA